MDTELRELINEILRRHDHQQDAHDLDVKLIADWHNKQIDKILAHDFFKYCQGCSCAAADLLKAERNKLKESK